MNLTEDYKEQVEVQLAPAVLATLSFLHKHVCKLQWREKSRNIKHKKRYSLKERQKKKLTR